MAPSSGPRALAACTLAVALLVACSLFETSPPPPPAPAAVPAPAPAQVPAPAVVPPQDLASPADKITRQLLDYGARLRALAPAELAAEVARLDALAAGAAGPLPAETKMYLGMALCQQHFPGDLARGAALLDSVAQGTAPELGPWQPMARLLASQAGEQRRQEDQLEHQAAQRRDTQRTLQQLTEKLEALKAIERSMITRSAGAPVPIGPAGAGGTGAETGPPPAKTP